MKKEKGGHLKTILQSSITESLLSALAAIVIGLLIGFVILMICNPSQAVGALGTIITGGMGLTGVTSALARICYYGMPLIMCGLSVGFAFKTGTFNIGASGQYWVGAFAAILTAHLLADSCGRFTWVVALLAAPFGLNLFNMDIDFTGGTTFTYDMGQQVTGDTVQQIQQAVGDIVGATPSVVTTGDGTQVMIKTHDLDSETRDALHQAMVDTFGLEDSARQDVQNVSPSVGKDMQAAAVKACLVAAVLMLLYITIRFDFKSGFSAVICLIHDILVMISAYVIFQLPLNMNFIAAALTIFGYSINATIITFDRIRENQTLLPGIQIRDLVNISDSQSLCRSIRTSVTTFSSMLVVTIVALVMGLDSILSFSIPMMAGIAMGTFNSICFVPSLWVWWQTKRGITVLKPAKKKAKTSV